MYIKCHKRSVHKDLRTRAQFGHKNGGGSKESQNF